MKNKPNVINLVCFAMLISILTTLPNCKKTKEIDTHPNTYPALPPVVTTNVISNVTNTSATCGGEVTSDGNSPVTSKGVCWHTSSEPTVDNSRTADGAGVGAFISEISSLNSNTTYYVRAYAHNNYGTSYGNEVSFTTTTTIYGIAPTVTTNVVTEISGATAKCGGEVTNPGSSAVIVFGVCWSTSPNPTINDSYTNDGTGIGPFSSILTDLTTNTNYFVRAYATNSEGTGYGNEVSFNTSGIGTSENPCPGLPFITDSRDGKIYATVQIGNQCWLYKNINYAMDSSWCWGNEGSNCDTYGRLYNWESAQGACPEGWHLPAYADWDALISFVGYDAGGKMKEEGTEHWLAPNTGATNESFFTALPGGFRDVSGNYFSINSRAAYWSSTEKSPSSPLAWYAYMVNYNATAYTMDNSKTYGMSVRCLKD